MGGSTLSNFNKSLKGRFYSRFRLCLCGVTDYKVNDHLGNPYKLLFDDLREEEKFNHLEPTRKVVLDTIRLTVYREETPMVATVRNFLTSPETARTMVKAPLFTHADIKPVTIRGNLNVILHPLREERLNIASQELIRTLNEAETVFQEQI